MEQDKWIATVLNSTNGMTKVTPSEALFSKIQNRINAENTVSTNWIWAVAASFAILLSINLKVIFSESQKSNSQTETIALSMSESNQLY